MANFPSLILLWLALASGSAFALPGKSWIIGNALSNLDRGLEKTLGIKVESCSFHRPTNGESALFKSMGDCATDLIWNWIENYFRSPAGKSFPTVTLDLSVRFKFTPVSAPARSIQIHWTPVGLSRNIQGSWLKKIDELAAAAYFYFDNELQLEAKETIHYSEIGATGQWLTRLGIPFLEIIKIRTVPVIEIKSGFLGIEYPETTGSKIYAQILSAGEKLPKADIRVSTDWHPGGDEFSSVDVEVNNPRGEVFHD